MGRYVFFVVVVASLSGTARAETPNVFRLSPSGGVTPTKNALEITRRLYWRPKQTAPAYNPGYPYGYSTPSLLGYAAPSLWLWPTIGFLTLPTPVSYGGYFPSGGGSGLSPSPSYGYVPSASTPSLMPSLWMGPFSPLGMAPPWGTMAPGPEAGPAVAQSATPSTPSPTGSSPSTGGSPASAYRPPAPYGGSSSGGGSGYPSAPYGYAYPALLPFGYGFPGYGIPSPLGYGGAPAYPYAGGPAPYGYGAPSAFGPPPSSAARPAPGEHRPPPPVATAPAPNVFDLPRPVAIPVVLVPTFPPPRPVAPLPPSRPEAQPPRCSGRLGEFDVYLRPSRNASGKLTGKYDVVIDTLKRRTPWRLSAEIELTAQKRWRRQGLTATAGRELVALGPLEPLDLASPREVRLWMYDPFSDRRASQMTCFVPAAPGSLRDRLRFYGRPDWTPAPPTTAVRPAFRPAGAH